MSAFPDPDAQLAPGHAREVASERPRVWFDVEDLFHFAVRNARPTGIQRVCFEIYQAAMADPAIARRIGFVRHATAERGFVEAHWSELEMLFRRVTERGPPARSRGKLEPASAHLKPQYPTPPSNFHPFASDSR